MTTNGFCHGLDTDNPAEAIIIRIKRACGYIIKRIPNILNNLLHSLVDLVIIAIASIFKKASRLIIEGFSLFVEALKIMIKPSSQITVAQKWDAISADSGAIRPPIPLKTGPPVPEQTGPGILL